MNRATIKPSIYIKTEGQGVATGQAFTMDALLEDGLSLQEKAHEITEALIGAVLNGPLDGAVEQIYGSVVALLEFRAMKMVEVK